MSFVVLDTDVASASFLGRLPDRLLPLATFNTKDFADFANYDGLQLVDVT